MLIILYVYINLIHWTDLLHIKTTSSLYLENHSQNSSMKLFLNKTISS